MPTLTISDERPAGGVIDSFVLEVPAPRISVRELIEYRVQDEVRRHNANLQVPFRGLVQPRPEEVELNGPRDSGRRPVDWRRQVEVAVEAFLHNGFFILVGERQVDGLDEEIDLETIDTATFIRLVPLVGG